MGHIGERYFDIDECPKCKGKKFKAVVTSPTIFYKKDGVVWCDEMDYNEEVEVFCCDCKEQIE